MDAKEHTLRRQRSAFAIILGLIVLGVSPAFAEKFTMKLAVIPQNDPLHEYIKEYERRIEEATDGAIEAELYPGAQLGPAPQLIEGLQLGTVEMLVLPPGFLKGIDPRFQAADGPGLFKSFDHAQASLTDPMFRDPFLDIGVSKGIKAVSIWVYGPTSYASLMPLRTLEDFEGRKFRVLASDVEVQLMDAIGATGVPMPFSEVLPALQRKQIDGVRSGWVVMAAMKFFTETKYITLVNEAYIPSVAFVSTKFLDKLPDHLRQAVIDVGRDIEPYMLKVAKKFDDRAEIAWKNGGAEVIRLSEADHAEFMRIAEEVGDETLGGDPEVKDMYLRLKESAEKND